jgi:colicin import membrane protein
MTVTSEELKSRRFATVRRRDGYETEEVDRFVHDIEDSVRDLETKGSALEEINTMLRLELATAKERLWTSEAELARVQAESQDVVAAPLVDDSVKSASRSAARLLEIAALEADRLVSEAFGQAEQLTQASMAEVRARAEALSAWVDEERAELQRMRGDTLRDLAGRRDELDARINRLVEFESQYREHLTSYLRAQLERLGHPSLAVALSTVETAERAS